MFNVITVALKPGVPAEPLLELAPSVAADGARIHLVTFIRVGTADDERNRMQQTEDTLEGYARLLRDGGYDVTYESAIIVADAGHEVSKAAQRVDADLLIIGLVKRSRVGKALLGSDAQATLMSAPCPVLSARVLE